MTLPNAVPSGTDPSVIFLIQTDPTGDSGKSSGGYLSFATEPTENWEDIIASNPNYQVFSEANDVPLIQDRWYIF